MSLTLALISDILQKAFEKPPEVHMTNAERKCDHAGCENRFAPDMKIRFSFDDFVLIAPREENEINLCGHHAAILRRTVYFLHDVPQFVEKEGDGVKVSWAKFAEVCADSSREEEKNAVAQFLIGLNILSLTPTGGSHVRECQSRNCINPTYDGKTLYFKRPHDAKVWPCFHYNANGTTQKDVEIIES